MEKPCGPPGPRNLQEGELSQAAVCPALPFAGLGFDLSPVLIKAANTALRRVRYMATRDSLVGRTETPGLAGYRLLTVLSREIRGR